METGVNQKYVNLLRNSFKKYKFQSTRGSSNAKEYEDKTRNKNLADNGNDNVKMKTRLQSERQSCKKVDVTELLQKAFEKYQTRDKEGQVSAPNQNTIVTKRYHYNNAKKNNTFTHVRL